MITPVIMVLVSVLLALSTNIFKGPEKKLVSSAVALPISGIAVYSWLLPPLETVIVFPIAVYCLWLILPHKKRKKKDPLKIR